jgi:hypothetical protein
MMRSIIGIAAAVAVVTCGGATAAVMTKEEYKAGKAQVAAQYVADRQKCGAHLGNAAELCVARARGEQKVAKAELEAAYKPSPKTQYDAAIARAQVAYEAAKKECGSKDGVMRKGCLKDAKAAENQARAAASAARKASTAEQGAAGRPAGAPR